MHDTNINVIEIIPPLVESELHDGRVLTAFWLMLLTNCCLAQGTTPQLSKIWMPLKDYIDETVKGLRLGKYQIPVGAAIGAYDRFEKAKMDAVYENSGIQIDQ